MLISTGVISLQNDRETSYQFYMQIQNELIFAINELRDKASQKYFNKNYEDLSPERQNIINKIYPFSISEAEPSKL